MIHKSLARPSAGRVATWVIALAVVAVVGILCVRHEMDLQVYYEAAIRAVHADPDLFQIRSSTGALAYRYAPALALLFAPLTLLPVPVAGFIWYLAKVVSLAITVRIAVRLAGSGQVSEARLFGIAFLLSGAYVIEEMATGNMHLLAMSCLVFACFGIERRQTVLPSAFLALAILAKITPALALPYLVVKRRWRVLIATLAILLALCLAPSLVVGHDTNMVWLRDWSRTALARVEAGPNEQDDSLKGALTRFFSASHVPPDKYPSVRLASVPGPVVLSAWAAFAATLLGLFLLTAGDRRKSDARRVFEYPLLFVTILLVSPHNTRIYYSALFFPYVMLAIVALRQPAGRPTRAVRAALWGSLIVNTLIPAVVPGRAASLAYQAVAPFVFSSLVAYGLLYVATRTPGPERAEAARRSGP